MKKIFLSYRFTGENLDELNLILTSMQKSLTRAGHSMFCSLGEEGFFKAQKFSTEEIYDYCLKKQEESDTILVFIKSEEQSIGIKKESDKARELEQGYILVIKSGLDFSEYRKLADEIIEYNSYEELYEKLKDLK